MNNVNILQNQASNIKNQSIVSCILIAIANYYSNILEQTVTVSQTKSLINAQCAFFALIMPMDLGMLYRAVALAWFVISVVQCKQRLQ